MSAMNPEEAAGRRVDAKAARSNERLTKRYSDNSADARRSVNARAQFLQSRALGHGSQITGGASHAR
jgi:hypothetical protein